MPRAAEPSPCRPAHQAGNQPCYAGSRPRVRYGLAAKRNQRTPTRSQLLQKRRLWGPRPLRNRGDREVLLPTSLIGTRHQGKSITSWRARAAPAPAEHMETAQREDEGRVVGLRHQRRGDVTAVPTSAPPTVPQNGFGNSEKAMPLFHPKTGGADGLCQGCCTTAPSSRCQCTSPDREHVGQGPEPSPLLRTPQQHRGMPASHSTAPPVPGQNPTALPGTSSSAGSRRDTPHGDGGHPPLPPLHGGAARQSPRAVLVPLTAPAFSPQRPPNAPLFTSAEPSVAPGTSPHAQGNSACTHVHTWAHALTSHTRDVPDHQGGEREVLHQTAAATPNHWYFQGRRGAIPAVPLAPPPKAAQLCLPRQRDAGNRHGTRPAAEESVQMGATHQCPLSPWKSFPSPSLDFAPPPLLLQPKPGQTHSFQRCRPSQRFGGVGSLDEDGDPAPHHLWHWGSTGSGTVPPEPHHTKRPAAGEASTAGAMAPDQVPPRCHLLLPGQPSRTPARAGGFASPLCLLPPTDSHSSFPCSPEDPSPCWAAQGSGGTRTATSPPRGAPWEGSVPLEGGGVSAPAFAPLRPTGGEEDGGTSLQHIIVPQPRFQRQRSLCNE